MEFLLLHALPLDDSMWAGQQELLPGATHAPTLYGLGATVEEWAAEALRLVQSDRLVVVGCSVGGSCAVEVAIAAPDRIAALVLIGTKAGHNPDPALHASSLKQVQEKGLEEAWNLSWEPLFSKSAEAAVIANAKAIAVRQSREDIWRGITAFHTRKPRDAFLARFSFPVVVVTGAEDCAPGLQTSALQAEQAPHGCLHVIPDCGHYVPLERPEHLNAILRDVIDSV